MREFCAARGQLVDGLGFAARRGDACHPDPSVLFIRISGNFIQHFR
jgi:hypothetical protein